MAKAESNFQTGKVLTVAGGHLAHDIYSSFLAPFLPLLIVKFGLTATLAGTLTIFLRLPSLANPFLGHLADRVEMRYMAIAAPGLTAVAMSLLGVAPSYAGLILLLIVAGISSSFYHVLAPVLVARLSGQSLGRGMGMWMTAGELARTVGPLVAVGAISLWGFERSYPVMVIGLLASLILYIQLRGTSTLSKKSQAVPLMETWRLMRPVMIPIIGIVIFRSFISSSMMIFLPTFMVDRGESLWFGGASLAVLELAGTVGTFFAGSLSDRVGRRPILLGALAASPVFTIALLYAPNWLLFPALVVLGLTLFAAQPVLLATVQENAQGQRGSANGLYMGIGFVAQAGAAVAVGWMADMFGFRTAFLINAFIGLGAIPIVFCLPKKKQVTEDEGG